MNMKFYTTVFFVCVFFQSYPLFVSSVPSCRICTRLKYRISLELVDIVLRFNCGRRKRKGEAEKCRTNMVDAIVVRACEESGCRTICVMNRFSAEIVKSAKVHFSQVR